MELTQYDDYPIHQAPYPFSYIPEPDYSWDEGYYFGVANPDAGIFLITGLRISPNSDVIGIHAGLNQNGVQRTLRLSREWRKHVDVSAGPYRVEFLEPFKKIRLVLEDNPSGLTFDVNWLGSGPAHLSAHHFATNRNRRVTDQTRYNQVGCAEGWIALNGQRWEVKPEDWLGVRDHSWGLYEGRPPLGGLAKWLPPAETPPVKRAIRFSHFFNSPEFNGHFHFHEDENGNQTLMNDAFGTPFEGAIDFGWERRLKLTNCTHKLVFAPGTRSVTSGLLTVNDVDGGVWTFDFKVSAPPHVIVPVGYHLGSWKDGGNIHTYHGPDNPYMEWDEFDFSSQPAQHTLYGETEPRTVYGVEHIGAVTITTPDGRKHQGKHQTEVFLNGRYAPYGFEAPAPKPGGHGLTGRGIL
jgi:hypothetical protein